MRSPLDICYFAQSWVSDWNHGNVHFLRGLASELVRMGHRVRCYEQLGSWSLTNLVRNEGERAIEAIDTFRQRFPQLDVHFYENREGFANEMARELRGADVVIFHEWNDPAVVQQVLGLKKKLGFAALLHDTHHRAYSDPGAILQMGLHLFDGVLAFGEALRRIYTHGFGVSRAWTFHEAADVENFHPVAAARDYDVLWLGNWGDEERTAELEEFLLRPAEELPEFDFVAHGVRYPQEARQKLREAGIQFRGYLPNLEAAAAYARSKIALHIPRRQYADGLGGIPTIRVFEALACGTALVCSPWEDCEKLFRAGEDHVCASSGTAMKSEIENLLHDEAARRQLASSGLQTIQRRHTCAHRATQLTEICEELGRSSRAQVA
jgi:spore maturation protein CgeB